MSYLWVQLKSGLYNNHYCMYNNNNNILYILMICVYWWCSCCCNMPRPMTIWYNIIIPVFCAWWAISYTVKTLLARTGSRMWALVLSFAALPKGGHKGRKHPEVGSWGIHGDTNMKQDSTMGGSQRLGIAVLFLNSQPKVHVQGLHTRRESHCCTLSS